MQKFLLYTKFFKFKAHFGKPDLKSEDRLKEILDELQIAREFQQFHDDCEEDLLFEIDRFPLIDLRPLLRQTLADLSTLKKDSTSYDERATV